MHTKKSASLRNLVNIDNSQIAGVDSELVGEVSLIWWVWLWLLLALMWWNKSLVTLTPRQQTAEVKRRTLENYSTLAMWFELIISAYTFAWHHCRKKTPRKTTEMLDWRYQAMDRNTRCRVCSARNRS